MKKLLSLMLSVIIICSLLATPAFAFEDSTLLVHIPTNDEIKSLTLWNDLLESDSSIEEVLMSMSTDNLLLTISQAAYYFETRDGSIEDMTIFVPAVLTNLVPFITDDEYCLLVSDSEKPDMLRLFLMDVYDNQYVVNSTQYNSILKSLAENENSSTLLRTYAVMNYDDVSGEKSELILNTYNETDTEAYKMVLLRNLYFFDEEKAKELSFEILDSHYTSESDVLLTTLANKTIIRTLDNPTQDDINNIVENNRKLIREENAMLTKGCLFALSEFPHEEAVEMLLDEVDFTKNQGFSYFIQKNFDTVINYLDSAPVDKIEKCILAAPVEEFRPYLEARQNKVRTASSSTIDYDTLFAAINIYNSPSTNRAVGNQGYAIYRDGVGSAGINVDWHAAIMAEASIYDDEPIVQASGSPENVDYVDYNKFMGGNNVFKGYRKVSGMTNSQRNKVVDIATDLVFEGIPYTFTALMTARIGKGIIEPSAILKMRCDGVVEYSYEYNGMRVQGTDSDWNISTDSGSQNHNAIAMTPKRQYNALVSA